MALVELCVLNIKLNSQLQCKVNNLSACKEHWL